MLSREEAVRLESRWKRKGREKDVRDRSASRNARETLHTLEHEVEDGARDVVDCREGEVGREG